jgi:cytosine/adenosine deaminase-related metal-dependent hydrolase
MIDMAQPSTEEYWKNFQQRLKNLLHQSPPTDTCGWGLSPHTPFTVSKELFHLAKQFLNHHRDILTTIHVAESREESRYFKSGSGPMADRIKVLNPSWTIPHSTTPVQYLNQNGWMPQLNLGVHLNEVHIKDLKSLAKNRIAVVHCPGSHDYFGHKKFSYGQMKKMRIPVCLGTDSLASNQSLSLFREMRLFKRKYPEVSSQEVLSLVTIKPAQALGRSGELGKVKPGYLADLIGVPIPKLKSRKENFYDYLVNYKKPVSFSMINGEPKLRLAEIRH